MEDDLSIALSGPDLSAAAAAAARRLADRAVSSGTADLAYAVVQSPLGSLVAAVTGRGLACLAYSGEGPEPVVEDLARRLSPRIVESQVRTDEVRRQLDEYFEGRRKNFELDLDWALVRGFARPVLQATAAIPFGEVRSYRRVAAAAGNERAARAAGHALSTNPIPIVVPCHRVVTSAGGLGGYSGGLERKRALLALEGVAPGSAV